MLKVKTRVTHYINYHDWDKFIEKEFPNCPYDCIISEEEMGNGVTWVAFIEGNLNVEEIRKIKAYLFKGVTEKYSGIGTCSILNYLVHEGDLPKGYYNIEISW